jgi:hypothetical protein
VVFELAMEGCHTVHDVLRTAVRDFCLRSISARGVGDRPRHGAGGDDGALAELEDDLRHESRLAGADGGGDGGGADGGGADADGDAV